MTGALRECQRCRLVLPGHMLRGPQQLCERCINVLKREQLEHPKVAVDAGKFRKLLVAVRREVEWLERTVVGMEACDVHDEDLVAQMRERARELRSCMERGSHAGTGSDDVSGRPDLLGGDV